MAQVTILKNTRRQAAVIANGTGQHWCNVGTLAYSNINGFVDQVVDTSNVELTITDIVYSADGSTTIKRNGNTIFLLTAGQDNYSFAQMHGFVLNQDASSNILIDFGANNGSVVLVLSKSAGYVDRDLQILPEYQR